jgi:hypothetical protein
MINEIRLRYLLCVLTGGVVLMAILPSSSWMCQIVGNSDWNRWAHFLVCLTVVVIPFAVWKNRSAILFPLIIVIVGILIEFTQMLIPGSHVQHQNVFSDLFGAGAGILLGLNIRVMRSSEKGEEKLDANHRGSTML